MDLVGRYLAVAHHPLFGLQAFRGVAIYDTGPDPYHPILINAISMSPCGLESSQLDPEAESGRPYVYCNLHCLADPAVFIANILTGQWTRDQLPECARSGRIAIGRLRLCR